MEQTSVYQPLLWERVAKWLWKQANVYKIPLFSTWICGLLAHGFAFSNKLLNADEVGHLFDKGYSYTSGRWGLDLMSFLFPDYSMPWIYGILSIGILSVAICLVVSIYKIQSKLIQALLAGCIIVFPALTGTIPFMYTLTSYALAFFLAVCAVALLQREKIWYTLGAFVCMVFSLSIYQAYVSIVVSFLVLSLIYRLLHHEDTLAVFRKGVFYVFFLAVSVAVYYGITTLIQRVLGEGFNSYADANFSFSLGALPQGIYEAYRAFSYFFRWNYWGLSSTPLCRNAHIILFAASLVLVLAWMLAQKQKDLFRFLLLTVLVGILPLSVCCIFMLVTVESVHTLVLYSFIAIYVFAAIAADVCLYANRLPGKISPLMDACHRCTVHILTLCMAIVLAANIYVANELYLGLYLRYENAYAFYTSIFAEIKMNPDFKEGTKSAFVGTHSEQEFYSERFSFSITQCNGFNPNSYPVSAFLEHYVGISIPLADWQECYELALTEEFRNMPIYPYYGSTKRIGDTIVIKLSDT